jgi:plastocyanin
MELGLMELGLTGRWRQCLAGGAVAAVLVLAGCGQGPPPAASSAQVSSSPASPGAAAGQRVTIEGSSALRFRPMTVPVHTGTVRITLKDMGAYPHNLVIPALGVTSKTVTGDPGSGSVSFTVTFAHPGRYAFHCQYHQSAGMTGVFVVS